MIIMEIGEFITSSLYPEKGKGRIVGVNNIDNDLVYDIFFSDTRELLSLNSDNIVKVKTFEDKLNDNIYDNPFLFSLRLLSEKVDSLAYQNKIISACNFGIMPLPHQVLTVNNVLEQQFLPRCLIADEVGLGKTIEAALIFEELKLRKIVKRILIVVPSGLAVQWKDELKTKFNEDFVLMNNDTFKGFQEIYGEENVWNNHDKVITSIDFLKPQPIKEELTQKVVERRQWHNKFITDQCIFSNWDMVIFDEAHNLSKSFEGLETARYKLGKRLADVTPILLLLTATPHQGDSGKFRNLLRLIDEYKFFAKDSLTPENVGSVTIKNNKRAAVDFKGNLIFKKRIPQIVKIPRIEGDIEEKLYNKVTEYVSKYYDLAAEQKNFPVMFLLIIYQRMVSSSSRAIFKSLNKRLNYIKKDLKAANIFPVIDENILKDVNAQEVMDEILDLQEELDIKNKKFKVQSFMENEIEILENCVDLARKASTGRQDFKMKKLLEIIDRVIFDERNPDIKFIIFTEFIETQSYIKDMLENLGYSVTLFNGKMNLDEKIASKNRFKNECQFLVTTDSGGEGINLQFCHVMINYDLPWNPMKIEQRIGRIDRIGQTNDVKIFNFVLENTIEEKVRSVLDDKLNLIAAEFGDDKKNDVLTALSDENNFDNIYMEAVTRNDIDIKELERIGASIYAQAKDILHNQDLLIPFTKSEDNHIIKKYLINNEDNLIKNLVTNYTFYNNTRIIEYSKKNGVYYFDDYVDGYKLKNVVFDRELAAENEDYIYLNFNNSFVKGIVKKNISQEVGVFNLQYTGYKEDILGTLFCYKFELTNNEGFLKRKIVPIFITNDGIYDVDVSNWFKNLKDYNFNQSFYNEYPDINDLRSLVTQIRDTEMNKFKTSTKLKLFEKLNKDKEKFDKYFEDKEFAIKKIAIDNIRIKQLDNLRNLRKEEINKSIRKKNLVPKIDLIAIARIELKKDIKI